jgi:large subunit ribosomal protein L19
MKNRLMALVEDAAARKESPLAEFQIGDTIDVHVRILEGTKERVQVFGGVVIARRSEGMRASFTVRRIVQGEGVERVFPLNSPKIAKIEVKRTGRVRRAKLFYLRDRVGKATRLRERKATASEVAANEAAKAVRKAKKSEEKKVSKAAKADKAAARAAAKAEAAK